MRNVNEYDKCAKILKKFESDSKPLIKAKDLINASKLLKKIKKIIFPVSEYPAPLEWVTKIKK